VQLSMRRSQGAVVIEVIDNGPGIPPERRAAVFARFHREGSSIPPERRAAVFARFHREGSSGDGYGLGLSIVQRAAQLHDAAIELLDAPSGRGLRVRVAIPGTPLA